MSAESVGIRTASESALPQPTPVPGLRAAADLGEVLRRIACAAEEVDRAGVFPREAFNLLAGCGVLGVTLRGAANGQRITFAQELRVVGDVSRADGSVGRILDGHFNAVERLAVAWPQTLGEDERAAIAAGELLLGVWGADPAPGEGEAARLRYEDGAISVHGVKTFCSGAGAVQRALVLARDEADQRRLVYVDVSQRVSIDRLWYRGEGLRAAESHRVVLAGAPVRAVLGGPGEMLAEPWFSRDAIRTSASWGGIAASVAAAALGFLRERGEASEVVALAAGRMQVACGTIERWLEYAGALAEAQLLLPRTAIEARWAIAAACREISEQAALACGSRPLTVGGALARGRRDLDLFLLQHRLEPLLARHGAAAIADGTPP